MYIYIAGSTVKDNDDVIGIFDLDNTSWSVHTRKFLSKAEKNGNILPDTDDIPKSFVLCRDNTIILTQPNTATLIKRLENQEKSNV